MVRSLRKRFRRAAPAIAIVLAFLVGGVSLWQALGIVSHLRSEARNQTRIFGSIVAALQDTTPELQTDQLVAIVRQITATGLPLILTGPSGNVTVCANLSIEPDPCAVATGDPDDPRN